MYIEEKYFFCSYLLHNIGGNKYHKKSKSISLTDDFNTAISFAKGRNKGQQFVIIAKNNIKKDHLRAEKLKLKLNDMGLKWYEDNHKETMQQDAIAPYDIIAIFDINRNILVINHFLIEKIDDNGFDILTMDIPINQEQFHILNKSLGNNGFVEFDEDENFIRRGQY